MRRALLCLAGLFLSTPALAQCEGTWENARMASELDALTELVAAFDSDGVSRSLKTVDRGFPCMEEVIDPSLLARYARIKGYLAFGDQDEEGAVMWLFYAKEVDDSAPWPVELPEEHPVLSLLAMWEPPEPVTASGQLVPPEKGAVFVNGRIALEPTATGEQQNFLQLLDRNGWPTEGFWMDGATFPGVLDDEAEPYEAPKYYNLDTGAVKKAAGPYREKQPKEPLDLPVVPLALTGGLAVTSGVTYMLAGAAQNSLATATTPEELTRARSSANLMVLISGAAAAGAVGVGVGGVILHSNGASVHFRF